jgi:hypothetical protein
MGITADVITSGPSVWGAANAACAATVFPWAWPVAGLLGLIISDPAQMWHAGERFGTVADHLRTASSQMTTSVARHADNDHWNEQGKNAFVANRVEPYQQSLAKSAQMFDDINSALRGCATAYEFAGLSSAVIGSEVLAAVAPLLAAAVLPGLDAPAVYVVNARMLAAGQKIRRIIATLAKVNNVALSIFGTVPKLGLALGAVGTEALTGFYYPNGPALRSFKDAEVTVQWPKQYDVGGTPVPKGYHAPTAAQSAAMKKITPESIKALGNDLDEGAARTIGQAYDQARGNDVGVPGFGLIGIATAHAYSEMRDHAADQLAACRDAPGNWLPGLRTTADNWIYTEQKNDRAVKRFD